jgi:hypothetical protein
MSTNRAIKQLKSVWGKAGLDHIPSEDETMGNMQQPEVPRKRVRTKSVRTARLDLRLATDEKKRIELMAVREGVSINEIFSRMLALYEREHGRVELTSARSSPVSSDD